MIRKFFSPPVFDTEEDSFRAKFINGFAWVAILALAISLIGEGGLDFQNTVTDSVILALILVQGFSLYLLRKGRIIISGLIIVVLGWIGLTYQAYSADGVKDVVVIAYIALALLATIVVNRLTGGILIAASIGVMWVLALLEVEGAIEPRIQDPVQYARDLSFIFIVITVLIYLSTTSLRDAINRANKSEENLKLSNKELLEINTTLEDRVTRRTIDLESANQRNEKRARQFEAIAQVARATASNESLDILLPRLASLISLQFGFYHTGIFLLDESRQYAVLRATNSEGGKRMLERGHKLQIGQTGIVGFVSAIGTPRIALDVGADSVYFDNPDLPNTRSEMALPLRTTGDVIGVLDIQSVEANAFHEDDIDVLTTLADQVTIAVQNAHTYEAMQELLQKAQRTSSAYIQDAWRIMQGEERIIGYRISGNEITSINKPLTSSQVKTAMQSNQIVMQSEDISLLTIPINLQEKVIGVMDIRKPTGYEWDEDEVDIAQAVSERLSLALETTVLLKATQRRAEIERITADISSKLTSTTQFDAILRTTAEELSRALGGSEVLVQIQSLETTGDSDG